MKIDFSLRPVLGAWGLLYNYIPAHSESPLNRRSYFCFCDSSLYFKRPYIRIYFENAYNDYDCGHLTASSGKNNFLSNSVSQSSYKKWKQNDCYSTFRINLVDNFATHCYCTPMESNRS